MSISSKFPSIRPTLLLDFANVGRLDPRITFTRASTATYFNELGVLTTAGSGVARFDYDPSTLQPRGLLIEEQRTNSLTYSDDFANAAWTPSGCSVSSNTIIAPDGTLTADKIIEDAANTNHWVFRTPSFTSGVTYTASVFAKAAERTQVHVQLGGTSAFGALTWAIFDLSTQTVVASNNTPTTSISSIGNGWFRLQVTKIATATGTPQLQVGPALAGNATYQGDGTSGIYVWGAQLEAGAFATSYIPTTTTALTRNADVASMTGTNFSSWFNANEGTIVTNFAFVGLRSVSAQRIIAFDDGSSNNLLAQSAGSTNAIGTSIVDAGSTQMATASPSTTFVANTTYKIGFGYALNNSVAAVDATIGTVDSACTIPAGITTFRLAASTTATTSDCWFQRIAYYPSRLPDATLQALTA